MGTRISIRTEMTAHIRGRIKEAGIKARVSNNPGCAFGIRVENVKFGLEFTEAEQATILNIAVVNGLTAVRGLPASINGYGATFYLTSEGIENARRLHEKYQHGGPRVRTRQQSRKFPPDAFERVFLGAR